MVRVRVTYHWLDDRRAPVWRAYADIDRTSLEVAARAGPRSMSRLLDFAGDEVKRGLVRGVERAKAGA